MRRLPFSQLAAADGKCAKHIMADILDFTPKSKATGNLIVATPLEFRRGDWHGGFAMLCTRQESLRYEEHRADALRYPNHSHLRLVPEHVSLANGYHYTVLGLFRYRHDEVMMRRVYHLAGLMECVMNAPSPVLRTDLLRRFYQSIMEEREALNMVWRGDVKHFLLPLDPSVYILDQFFQSIANARSLKELYSRIHAETNAQFDLLNRWYVFYLPHTLSPPG
jgi:hypothetical protein